ncbi:ribokinase [Ornithinimicrobium faecis]|uniref:ribokinase n=1 Tax=Ornithinimicrobium faecis TaxID=2934158 RepID=UPI00211884FF|nr:ribokinase [Ornithinimicrobium sp. HY1745]
MEVVVVGSANLDVVVPVARSPRPGETLLGGDIARHPGGKGANQAVAAARAGGAATLFIGALGGDADGALLRAALDEGGVDTDLIEEVSAATGTALIWVTPEGENTIIVAPGANSRLTLSAAQVDAIQRAPVVLAQLEIPLGVVAEIGRVKGPTTRFVLNAAPSADLPAEVLAGVDVLVVNEHEAADLSGVADETGAAAELLLKKVPAVVITLGSEGALVAQRSADLVRIAAYPVEPVDTTGAGDAFCGVLAAALAQGRSLAEAARLGCAAGALATLAPGAQSGMPVFDDVRALAAESD